MKQIGVKGTTDDVRERINIICRPDAGEFTGKFPFFLTPTLSRRMGEGVQKDG
jgi:hypothetical protein